MPKDLTQTAIIRAARESAEAGKRKDLADAACPGLRLRFTPSGGKSWVLACRDREGRMRRYPLGTYPAMGIREARDAARALHVKVKQEGADLVAERKRVRAIARDAKAGIGTLAALVALYEDKESSKLKRWPECRRRIESVFVPHLDRPLATLKAADLQMTADAWEAQQSASAAVRYLRPIVKWAERRQYVAAGVADIVPPATVGRRKRVLSHAELAAVLPVLKASPRPYAASLRFMLLTLARREEVCSARWRDVDLDANLWRIPETKNGEPHEVPLSRQAMALLNSRLPGGEDGSPATPDPAALVFATATGARLGNWDRATKAIHKASSTEGWNRHDLRRTGATMLGDMGVLPDIIEAALNHVAIRSPLAATYNRSRYRKQVADALQRLADALDSIEAGGAAVIPLPVRRA